MHATLSPSANVAARHYDAEAVKAKIAKAQALLSEQLEALKTSEDWRRTLERMAILGPTGISRFSFRNILLLLAQRPEVRHAATFNAWRQMGRGVRKGEKGLTVLRPRVVKVESSDVGQDEAESRLVGFTAMAVFDLEQTEGEPLPAAIMPKQIDTPEGFGWTVDGLREFALTLPGVAGITIRAREGPT